MRELALHILDLIENSIKAGATITAVEIVEDPARDLMRITVEDNGPGLGVAPEQALDPFYTTKKGKKTGLGLSLFRFHIEQAGGRLVLDRSTLGGLAVRARLSLSHVDRNPLGDLAATLSSVLAANPELELRLRLKVGEQELVLQGRRGSAEIPVNRLAVARKFHQQIKEGLEALQIKE